MTTSTIPFLIRQAVNPILSDHLVIEDDTSPRAAFLTPLANRFDRFVPLASAGIAGLFLLIAAVGRKLGGPEELANFAVLIAFVLGGIPGLKSAWQSLVEKRVDIDVLMILGACLAAFIGKPIEGALLLFLFSLSGALETEAARRTKSAIRSLRDLNPSDAILIDESGQQKTVPTKYVPIGAHALIRPGDKVPIDGVIVEGESSIDEAPITGESMPRTKTAGDAVYAGTINTTGRLVIEVTKVAADTQLAKIIRLVTSAPGQQSRTERLFDRISPKYAIGVITTTVLFGALAPWVSSLSYRDSIYRAIALLIVASPCALIIATPIAYLSSIAAAARKGVLIKGGVYLEILARCRSVVFDKTGTLTTGQPSVCDIVTTNGLSEDDALRLAGALEASSSHPLASAINAALSRRHLSPYEVTHVELVAGQGVRGLMGDKHVALGKAAFAEQFIAPDNRRMMAELSRQVQADERTAAVLVFDQQAAILTFEDPVRPDAKQTIADLRSHGLEQIIMLTGDQADVARRVAESLNLDGFHAGLLPEDKITRAQTIRSSAGPLVVVGDGVNDAPALARADVGIAMASIGSDAALEAAPIVLMNNTLTQLTWLMGQARCTAHIVRQNLTLAIAVIVLMSALTMAGEVKLPIAVMAHEGSTLVVALNALRLLRA